MVDGFRFSALFVGTVLAALGFTLVGINAFESRVFPVFAGYLSIVFGYKIQWYVVNRFQSFHKIRHYLDDSTEFYLHFRENLRNYLFIVLGLLLASGGTVMFAQTVVSFSIVEALSSGLLCLSGYMIAHEGFNEVLL